MTREPHRSFADRLNRLFADVRPPGEAREYTNSEVAAATGVSASYIGYLRKGLRDNPSVEAVQSLARFFRVRPSYFVDRPDNPEPARGAPFQVAVCGPARCTEVERASAHRLGELLAERGVVVLCGGGAGVMAAVAAGVRARCGLVVGIRPDAERDGSSADVSATIRTNMGQARNAIIVTSADLVISVGGSWGTLSEVALAMRLGVPVIALGGWTVAGPDGEPVPGIHHVTTPEDAVRDLESYGWS